MPGSSDLLDVNVWLALAAEAHMHHERAERYWRDQAAATAVFCRITHLAFLRHLTNETIMGTYVLKPAQAWKKCGEFLALPEVRLVPEPAGLDQQLEEFCNLGRTSPNLWTDAYLAAFATCSGLRLVTFDSGFSRFSGLDLLVLDSN